MRRSILINVAVITACIMMAMPAEAGTWVRKGTEWAYTEGASYKDGWIQDGGKIYYIDPATKLMVKGWNNIGGILYLFGTDGALIYDISGNLWNGTGVDCAATGSCGAVQNAAGPVAGNQNQLDGNIKLDMNYSGIQYDIKSGTESYDAMAREVFDLVNAYRIANGREALKYNDTLNEVAMKRSEELSRSYSHMRPDGTKCFTLYKQNGYRYSAAGENIAYGQKTASEVFEAWKQSERHRKNMLGDYEEMGVGVYQANGVYYWSQNFGTVLRTG